MKDKQQIKLSIFPELVTLFEEMADHLEYCGYGDAWERECADDLINNVGTMKKRLADFGFIEP